jgi:hypothetical protein
MADAPTEVWCGMTITDEGADLRFASLSHREAVSDAAFISDGDQYPCLAYRYVLASPFVPIAVTRDTIDALSDCADGMTADSQYRRMHPDDTRRVIAAHLLRCVVSDAGGAHNATAEER